jgi:NAD(P)H dehydrogenase (quinone)
MSMRVLLVFAHPVPESYGAALHQVTVETLRAAGHVVDDCDLYAENFQPVLTTEERRGYHDCPANIVPVANYVERLRDAEILVVVTPVWNFGWPAILKGYFDRVFLPDVSFQLRDGKVRGALTNIRRIVFITTYGATRWRAWLAGDPPRKIACCVLKAVTNFKAPVTYIAHYDMNRSTPETRAEFLSDVRKKLARL